MVGRNYFKHKLVQVRLIDVNSMNILKMFEAHLKKILWGNTECEHMDRRL